MTSAVPAGAVPPGTAGDEYSFAAAPRSRWAFAGRRFFRHRLAVTSLVVFSFIVVVGLLADTLAPYPYDQVNRHALGLAPSWAHPFGTDSVGRDYLSRVLFGTGTEIRIALLVAFVGTLIGTLVGASAGYFGGFFDHLVMRAIDLFLTMPPLIVLLVGAIYLHATTIFQVSLLIAGVVWMPVARMVRGSCLSLREKEYVEAARAMGASDLRIIARHILPNAIGTVAVAATVMTAGAVILETTIAYLGFGITNFVRGNQRKSLGDVMFVANGDGLFHWWGLFFPGLAIVLIVAPIYFIGDGIRDAFDPTQRRNVKVRPRRTTPSLARRTFARLPGAPLLVRSAKAMAAGVRSSVSLLALLIHPALAAAGSARTAIDARFERRSRARASRRRGPLRLVLEAIAVVGITAGVAAGIYIWKVHDIKSPWRIAGLDVQNVSHAVGAQTEVSVAVAPTNPHVLFAASNDSLERTIRVYTSADAGGTWSSAVGPALGPEACARGEPAAAIARNGHEYVAFTVNPHCLKYDPTPYLVVAHRADPRARWSVHRVVSARSADAWDDKPSLAAAPDGRVYVAWTRLVRKDYATVVVSSSADRGRSWLRPRIVGQRLFFPQLVSITVSPRGTLYLTGVDVHFGGIWVARSTNHGRSFNVRGAALLEDSNAASCMLASYVPIPQQANRCLGPNPTVVATADRVYVIYAAGTAYSTAGTAVVVFDPALQLLWHGPIGPRRGKSAQFWPAAAVDLRTGRLWACFYDTTGDPSRARAWFSCTASHDGRHWATPVRAVRDPADTAVLWEDARIYGFGDEVGFGGYTGLAVADGVAHPMWIDTRDLNGRKQEIFAARIAASALRR